MAAPIVVKGTALEPGLPAALFQPRIVVGVTGTAGLRQQYDVAPDGRFLINLRSADTTAAPPAPITVVLNWQEALKRPVATK
jgi:hypothetical protein